MIRHVKTWYDSKKSTRYWQLLSLTGMVVWTYKMVNSTPSSVVTGGYWITYYRCCGKHVRVWEEVSEKDALDKIKGWV